MGETLEAADARVANYGILKLHLNEQTRRLGDRPGDTEIQEHNEARRGVSPVLCLRY